MGEEMERFIAGGEAPEWYRQFKEDNGHLLSDDGKQFVFSPENPLILSDVEEKVDPNKRGGVKEFREMQKIAQKNTTKHYRGMKTTEDWGSTFAEWAAPELLDIVEEFNPRQIGEFEASINTNDYSSAIRILNQTWMVAPDNIGLHSRSGWNVLCDLISESYLVEEEY